MLLIVLPQSSQLQESVQQPVMVWDKFNPVLVKDWNQAARDLREFRALWESFAIRNYRLVVDKGCFGCAWYYPAELSIMGDSVVAAANPETGEPIPKAAGSTMPGYRDDLDTSYQTVDEIFAVIEKAIANNPDTAHPGQKTGLSVLYDEVYGYPIWVSVDYSRGIAADGSVVLVSDSGMNYRILEFAPLP